jgi:hypothetical protein
MITKLTQDASSSATAQAIHSGLISLIARSTDRSAGTESSNEMPSATRRPAVATRLPTLGRRFE